MKIYKCFLNGGNGSQYGRELLKKAVSENYGISDFDVYYNQNGKPLIDCCFFSISHKGNMAVCAIDDNEVGIDIEQIKPITARKKYKLLSEEESEYVNFDSTERDIRFLRVFTMKEAFIKMRGGKLKDAAMLNTVKDGRLITDFDDFCFETEISDEYIITVCYKK